MLKQFIAPYILDPSAHWAEPVAFEVLRHALPAEVPHLTQQFAILPLLPTPADLWERAAVLGRVCRQKGHTLGALDLLIATIALAHNALVLTFDRDFQKLGAAGGVQVKVLNRPPL
jgi:predicted nucleic acid-binding protein